ncbi:TolC family protein [Ruminiclostridium cellobioparum]|uniref:TolC family protein n=1 Tax=Ruminiclostridium cellobioparum TaxID=29355 RepID=UPI0028AF0F92|nr:TolC family protein [Ruminiclostridium cellobioparum]
MIHKNKRLYICLLIILALVFHIQGVSVAADNSNGKQNTNNVSQPLKLSLENAIKKGVDSSSQLSSIDLSIKKYWRVTDEDKSFKDITSVTQKDLDNIDEYYKLVERKILYDNLSFFEEDQIIEYKKEYGDIPPPYSRQNLLESYFNGRAFSSYSSWLQVLSLKDSYNTNRAKLEGDIQAAYYNLLYFNELYQSLEDSFNTMEKQYSGMVLKYEKGLVSELDKYKFEVELSKKKLQLQKSKRNREYQELVLKQICGIERSQAIELTGKEAGLNKEYKLDTYKNYLDKALAKRSEVVSAKLQLDVYKQELEYYDKYIRQQYTFARTNLQQQLEDSEFAVTQSTLNITGDIQAAYTDAKSVQSQLEIKKRDSQNKKSDYNIAEKKYSQGQLSLVELWNAKDAANNAEIEYKKAQRDSAYCFYRLEELACKLGPGYQVNGANVAILE